MLSLALTSPLFMKSLAPFLFKRGLHLRTYFHSYLERTYLHGLVAGRAGLFLLLSGMVGALSRGCWQGIVKGRLKGPWRITWGILKERDQCFLRTSR